jgi:hypothetical protein
MKVTVALIVAGAVLFGASLSHSFHFDDALIAADSNVTNPARWAHFFNPFHLRQLTFFSFYLNHLAGGLNPAGYHAVNVAIHIANAVLLFWLLRRFLEHWIATAAAAIFLVHPIQTESVLYVYQRSTLLACFFSLLGLTALAKRRIGWAILAFVCAFESKESALAVPLAVALLATTKRWREISLNLPRSFDAARMFVLANGMKYLFALLAVAFGAFALILLLDEKTVGFSTGVHPLRYLLTQTRVVYTYIRLLIWPYPQSLEYDFQNVGGFLTAAGVVAMLATAWFWRSVSVLAFFVLLTPTSSIIPSADAAFEHRLYLPMLAFAVFAAYCLSKLRGRTWIAASLILILAVLTVRREIVWSSDITLWEDTVKHAPGKARVWFNLGGAYLSSDPDRARTAFLRALELQPHFPEALYDLGVIEQGKKNWFPALSYYERSNFLRKLCA